MSEKTFSLPIKKYSILNNDDNFLYVRLQIIKEGLNLNDSNFLLSGMKECKDTFHQKPLLCSFPKDFTTGDFKLGDGHNGELKYNSDEDIYYYSYLDPSSERCIGFVPQESNIDIQQIDGANWLVLDAIIWKAYNYELTQQLLQNKNKKYKISVEISVTKFYEQENIEYIEEFIGDGITLLAIDDSVLEGIPGANLKVYTQSDKYTKYKQVMNFALKGGKKVFDQLSMNELIRAINKILDKYTYEVSDDWTTNKYWIDDIKGNDVILYDNEEEQFVIVSYSIDENSEVALDMDNIQEVEIEYVPKKAFVKNVLFISKDKFGSKDNITIDKSKDNMSETVWGDVDKSQLKKDCLMAKNWKAICKAVFMELDDGWENGKEDSLGFPVMQKLGEKLIYNRYGLASAKDYAEKNNNSAVLVKVNAIYKKLGLDDQSKKEENSLKFIEQAKQAGFAFLGLNKGNLMFAKEEECKTEMEEKEMSLYTISFEEVNKDGDKEFKSEDLKAESIKMSEEGGDNEEYAKLQVEKDQLAKDKEEMEAKNTEMSAKYAELEQSYEVEKADKEKLASEKEEMAKEAEKQTEAKKEVEEKYSQLIKSQFEAETNAILSNEDLSLADSDREELLNMRKENKFASIEDFTKEIVYRQYVNKNKNNGSSLTFGLNHKGSHKPVDESEIDTLLKKYK